MVYQKDWEPKKKDWVWYPSYAENPDDLISLPLFVDMRSYFLKKRFSPFIAQKVGYAFVLGRDYNISGFYSDTSVGFRFFNKKVSWYKFICRIYNARDKRPTKHTRICTYGRKLNIGYKYKTWI